MLTARTARFEIPEAQHQFGGFGGTVGGGITIPIFGSGGAFAGGLRGGVIPGGGVVGAGGSGINPFSTLESAFGTGFTSRSIADAILVAEQEGRFTGEGPATGAISIATGPIVTLVLNLARGLFEVLSNESGNVLARGVTPEAALEALRAGSGPGIPQGGGGGPEPLPFPRRSPPSPPLPLSHLRRLRRLSLLPKRFLRSWDSWRSYFAVGIHRSERRYRRLRQSRSSRRSPRQTSRPLSRLLRREYDLEARSTSRWSWARRVIPPEYAVRVFQIKNNSPGRSKSGKSSPTCSRFGKHDRTQTSNAELLSSSLPRGWNN